MCENASEECLRGIQSVIQNYQPPHHTAPRPRIVEKSTLCILALLNYTVSHFRYAFSHCTSSPYGFGGNYHTISLRRIAQCLVRANFKSSFSLRIWNRSHRKWRRIVFLISYLHINLWQITWRNIGFNGNLQVTISRRNIDLNCHTEPERQYACLLTFIVRLRRTAAADLTIMSPHFCIYN